MTSGLSGLSGLNDIPKRSSGGSLTPDQIAGLQLWYAANAITGKVDGDALTSWTDAGSQGKNLAEATNPPSYRTNVINSLPVVRFDGTNDTLTAASITAIAQPLTVFMVVKSNNLSKDRYWDTRITGRTLFGNDTSGYELYAGSSVLTGGSRDTSFHIFTVVYNGASSIARRDGTSIITGNPGAGSMTPEFVVGSDGLGGDFLSGDVAECGVYNVSLSTANHNALGQGLATKYGLTWNAF